MKTSSQSSQITVRVPGTEYPIVIENGLIDRIGERLQPLASWRKVFILSDTNIWKLWGGPLMRSLKVLKPQEILVPPGERYKRLSTVERITVELSNKGAERSSLLIAFGGGVVGDMGGFAASTYLRGIDCVQIPTTLLAMVDSAIGGKTGVNLTVGKNLVGAFHQPKMVLTDPRLLKTLPERERRAGLYESIKCGVIGDAELFDFMENNRRQILLNQPDALERVIRASAGLKARVVGADEKEGGLRRTLNYGHTVGHALETATHYRRFLHGEAVAWGMLAVNRLAFLKGLLSADDAVRIDRLICAYGPVPSLGKNLKLASVLSHMAADKKVRNGTIHFVLPERIGQVKVTPGISNAEVSAVLRSFVRDNPFRASEKSK